MQVPADDAKRLFLHDKRNAAQKYDWACSDSLPQGE